MAENTRKSKWNSWAEYQKYYRDTHPEQEKRHRFTSAVSCILRYCKDHPEAIEYVRERLAGLLELRSEGL